MKASTTRKSSPHGYLDSGRPGGVEYTGEHYDDDVARRDDQLPGLRTRLRLVPHVARLPRRHRPPPVAQNVALDAADGRGIHPAYSATGGDARPRQPAPPDCGRSRGQYGCAEGAGRHHRPLPRPGHRATTRFDDLHRGGPRRTHSPIFAAGAETQGQASTQPVHPMCVELLIDRFGLPASYKEANSRGRPSSRRPASTIVADAYTAVVAPLSPKRVEAIHRERRGSMPTVPGWSQHWMPMAPG